MKKAIFAILAASSISLCAVAEETKKVEHAADGATTTTTTDTSHNGITGNNTTETKMETEDKNGDTTHKEKHVKVTDAKTGKTKKVSHKMKKKNADGTETEAKSKTE